MLGTRDSQMTSKPLNAEDLRERRKSAVDNLERLFTILVGLSLAAAVAKLITIAGSPGQGGPITNVWRLSPMEFHYDTLPMFIAFVVTLVPFYHGINRYLFSTYVFRDSQDNIPPIFAMVDFAFFFLLGLVFFAMSLILAEPVPFFWTYVVLLAFDCLWLLFVYRSSERTFDEIQAWLWTNLLTIAVVTPILLAEHIRLDRLLPDWLIVDDAGRSVLLMLVAIVRTAFDYWKSWPVYWPGSQQPVAP